MNFLWKKSARRFGTATLKKRGGDDALDEIGLVGAGGVDRRGGLGSRLLRARGSIVGAAEKASQNAHGQLQFRLVS